MLASGGWVLGGGWWVVGVGCWGLQWVRLKRAVRVILGVWDEIGSRVCEMGLRELGTFSLYLGQVRGVLHGLNASLAEKREFSLTGLDRSGDSYGKIMVQVGACRTMCVELAQKKSTSLGSARSLEAKQ